MEERSNAELLRLFLADRDEACPRCGYNLRALRAENCPECGEALLLRVGLTQPKLGAMLAGLMGLSAGAGLNGLLLVYWMIRVLWSGPWLLRFATYNGVGLVIEGGALAGWLMLWRQIRHQSTITRRLLACACWLLTVVNIVAFSIVIR